MKEQTPIEELRLEIIKHLPNNPDAVFDIMSKANKVTQAKVLEALERELRILWFWEEYEWTDREKEIAEENFKEHIETEVKPKYNPEN
jgi:hypothetical protein